MSTSISIADLDRAAVLAALYNASQPQGLGFLHPASSKPLTVEQAAEILADTPHSYFDYLNGRVMKVDLSSDDVNPWGYDRDNGTGAFQRAIDSLRRSVTA